MEEGVDALACDVQRLLEAFSIVVGDIEPDDPPETMLSPDKAKSLLESLVEVHQLRRPKI